MAQHNFQIGEILPNLVTLKGPLSPSACVSTLIMTKNDEFFRIIFLTNFCGSYLIVSGALGSLKIGSLLYFSNWSHWAYNSNEQAFCILCFLLWQKFCCYESMFPTFNLLQVTSCLLVSENLQK